MKRNVLQKRVLSWFLILSMCIGMFPAMAWANDTSDAKLLTGKEATTAMEVIYEENFDNYADTTLTEGENDTYRLFVPEGTTAEIKEGKLYYEATDAKPLYILGGEMWGYYTIEAEITPQTALAEMNLGFYVQDADTWSKAAKEDATADTIYRMKVVANGTTAQAYYALGSGDWTALGEAFQVAKGAQSGSVGFAMTPADGLASAMVSIDNVKVTHNMVDDAKHTIFAVDFAKYASTATLGTSSNHTDYYVTKNSNIIVAGENEKLHIQGTQSGVGVMYFNVPDAAHWKNYVVEADIEYAEGTTGWGGLLYRVQNTSSFQVGYANEDGTAGLKGYWNEWANDGTDNGIYHETEFAATVGETRRIKIVVQDQLADLYVASYTEGVLGEWEYLMSINDVADHHPNGSVGFVAVDGAEYWVDNLKVYEYATTYREDFNSYEATGLTEGEHTTVGMNVDLYDTTPADMNLTGTALEVKGNSTSSFNLAWFTAGNSWTNYTYEADVTSETLGSGYHGVAYRVDSSTLWQRAGIRYQGANVVLNELGAFVDTKFTSNNFKIDRLYSKNIGFTSGATLRVKVVVKNNVSWIYSASYTNGVLGPYNLHAVLDTCKSFTGAAGIVVSGTSKVIYDNVVVSAVECETDTTNLVDIYVPETGIVNPATIVTKVNAGNINQLEKSAVAILDVNADLDVIDGGTVVGSVAQFMHKYGESVIPAFYIDNDAEVTAICKYLKQHGIMDAFYVVDSDHVALLQTARDNENKNGSEIGWKFARGIVEYKTMPEDYAARAESRRVINKNHAYIAILPAEGLDVDIVAEYNARAVSVWSYAKDMAGVYAGIARGYNGTITSDPSMVAEVYQSIAAPTLSGKPVVIGHQGKHQTANGMYGNTIEAFRSAMDDDNTMGFETDPQLTADKTIDTIILMHDPYLSYTTTYPATTSDKGVIANMTLEQIREYTVQNGEEIPTLEQAFELLAEYKANGKYPVMYFNTGVDTDKLYLKAINEFSTEYGVEDQVIVFCRHPVISQSTSSYLWTNDEWGNGLPIVGSTVGSTYARLEQVLEEGTTKQELISGMISTLASYNHQQIPYDYDLISDTITDKEEKDSLTYEMAARGFLMIQSTADEQEDLDRFYISEMGTTLTLSNYPDRTTEYCYQIDGKNQTVKIGNALDLNQTVKMLKGTVDTTCGATWICGDVVTKTEDSYTMKKAGEATFVYYADVEQERSSGTPLAYRVYSEPVMVTWNETGYICGHESLTEYKYTDGYHYQKCTECGKALNIESHKEELVNAKEETTTEAGYTGDLVCKVCGYVVEKGNEIPADPFKGYTTITPADFGLEDGVYTAAKASTKTPLVTFDKVNFTMDFSGTLEHYDGFIYGKTNNNVGEGLLFAYHTSGYPGRLMIANQTRFTLLNPDKTKVAGQNLYLRATDAFPNGEYTSFVGAQVRLNITTELCELDDDGNRNDLKVGFWFNGRLYQEQYYYLADITGGTYKLNHDFRTEELTEGITIASPFVNKTSPLDGYNIVTPSTFGVADQDNAEGFTAQTPIADNIKPSKYDKTAFVANVKYTTSWGYLAFLQHNITGPGIQVQFDTLNQIRIYNYLNNRTTEDGLMYAGGYFSEDGTTYMGDETAIYAKSKCYTIPASVANLEGDTYKNEQFVLWLTIDIVDFDNDGTRDDMKLGVWINGQLCKDTYLYITNCDAQAGNNGFYIRERVIVNNMTHISSPVMGLDEVGMVAGEYMLSDSEFYPSELTNNVLMNGKKFETTIRFEGEGSTFYYGSKDNAVKFTSTADGIKVTHTYGTEETDITLLDFESVGVNVTKRAFDLKISTDVVDLDSDGTKDDVKLGIWVEDMYKYFYIEEAATLLTAQAGVKCENGASVVLGTTDSYNPDKVDYCLDNGTYEKAWSESIERLSLNGIAYKQNIILDACGVYRIATTTNGIVHRDEIVAYWENDVTADNEVSAADLVRMLKVADDEKHDETVAELVEAGKKAIGYEEASLWTEEDEVVALAKIRNKLIGK